MGSDTRCRNCGTVLIGEYCHACGQRDEGRITATSFFHDVRRRVFRLDYAFVATVWGMLRDPGSLVRAFLAGHRKRVFDPLQFFISSVFVQIVVAMITQALAPVIHRLSALNWLSHLGGMVAVKILTIFWVGSLWRVFYRDRQYNLGEIYVFATYTLATTNLLWAALPLLDLVIPAPLGADADLVTYTLIGIETLYLIYAVHSFAQLSWWRCVVRVGTVVVMGYTSLTALVGLEKTIQLMMPLMPSN